jgi:hypothetical protein
MDGYFNNAHLDMMSKEKPAVKTRTWQSASVFEIPVTFFDTPTQKRFLRFVTQTPDTSVRQASARFSPDAQRFFTKLYLEADEFDEAVINTAMTVLGGLACVGIKPQEAKLVDIHVAWMMELQLDPGLHLEDAAFDQTKLARPTFESVKNTLFDAA